VSAAAKVVGGEDLGEFTARQKTAAAAHRDRAVVGVKVNRIGEYFCGACGAPIFRDEQGAWAHGVAR